MDSDNFLMAVTVIAVLVSIVGLSITYNSVSSFQNILTGYVTENGTVNITIESSTRINITHAAGTEGSKSIDWGSAVITDQDFAFVCTNGTVDGGEWTPISDGFIIRNIGNTNVTLGVHSTKSAADFLGGSGPDFLYNITDYTEGSCNDWSPSYINGDYVSFDTTSADICDDFGRDDPSDKLRLDVCLKIPSGATAEEKDTTIVLTYDAV
jgi:hypothetical protein